MLTFIIYLIYYKKKNKFTENRFFLKIQKPFGLVIRVTVLNDFNSRVVNLVNYDGEYLLFK